MKIPSLQTLEDNQSLIQLGLLNFGLLIMLVKQIGFLYSVFSFATIFTIIALTYHHVLRHGKPEPDQSPIKLFDEDIINRVGLIRTGVMEKLNSFKQDQQETKKRNSILVMLVVVYFCMIFVNDWIEAFILLNFAYVHFFMPQLSDKAGTIVCRLMKNQCPFTGKGRQEMRKD